MVVRKIIMSFFTLSAFCLLFLFQVNSINADERAGVPNSSKEEASTEDDLFGLTEIPVKTIKKTSKWVERQRDFLSDTFHNSAIGLDSWMGGERTEDILKKDESYVRLRFRSSHRKSGEYEREFNFKMRLDLPNTRRRVKLFFESSEEETEDLLDKTLANASDSENKDNQDSVAGFRFLNDAKRKWKISNDVGVRSRLPLDPFWRFEARRTWDLSEHWKGTVEEKLWYFDTKGFGNETKVYFDRPINDVYSMRISTQAQYQDRYDYWQFVNAISTVHLLNENSSIAYGVGINSNSKPTFRAESYFIVSTYRKKLYKDWLFLEVRPGLVFSRVNNFKAEPAITAEIDVYFTN